MKVVGYFKKEYKFDDGKSCSGVKLFLAYPITNNGEGDAVDAVFVSDNKLMRSSYFPTVGDDITVNYNRFGKVDSITVVR